MNVLQRVVKNENNRPGKGNPIREEPGSSAWITGHFPNISSLQLCAGITSASLPRFSGKERERKKVLYSFFISLNNKPTPTKGQVSGPWGEMCCSAGFTLILHFPGHFLTIQHIFQHICPVFHNSKRGLHRMFPIKPIQNQDLLLKEMRNCVGPLHYSITWSLTAHFKVVLIPSNCLQHKERV